MKTENSPQEQLVAKIKSSGNILVTLARDPSVDALASAIALTLALDKLNKHATAVFSGEVPSVLNFLEPEKTFETNADSLRDFVISLSKDKADRLRFKPEGDTVRIYITPYRTKLSAEDLSFSEGDFNIELVIAIGVDSRDDLDEAIASHGRILHSATTATIGIDDEKDRLGTISWQNPESSSYSEMIDSLITQLSDDKSFMDEHIATAVLTGLVSATDQFRNEKTSTTVMAMAAELMGKGANQQLIASELASSNVVAENIHTEEKTETKPKPAHIRDGLQISHEEQPSSNWNPKYKQEEQIKEENAKFAEQKANLASEEAKNQLEKIQSSQKTEPVQSQNNVEPVENNELIDQLPPPPPLPEIPGAELPPLEVSQPIADPAPTTPQNSDLDQLLANAANTATPANNTQIAVENTVNESLSHGMPYVNEEVSPLNSALLNENFSTEQPPQQGFITDSRTTVMPIPGDPAMQQQMTPPQLTTDFGTVTPLESLPQTAAPTSAEFGGLPPVPPLAPAEPAPINNDISALAQSAAEIASVTPQSFEANQIPAAPAPEQIIAPAPMINQPPIQPIQADPTQFQIPGM